MLANIPPLLTGDLLRILDRMGHSDAIVVADAHFPAHRLGEVVLDIPGCGVPDLLAAVRWVLPLDDGDSLVVMSPADGERPAVHREIEEAAGTSATSVDRDAFYELAAGASAIVRTGETRVFANALLRKGVVTAPVGA